MNDVPSPDQLFARPFFFVGIGGSGMLPLAQIVGGRGVTVAGSDRSRDQGRTPEKFAWLESLGFALFPQDGSGIAAAAQTLVASAAVEDSVPEVVRAHELGCARMSRAELLALPAGQGPEQAAQCRAASMLRLPAALLGQVPTSLLRRD